MSSPVLQLTQDLSFASDVIYGLSRAGQKSLPSTYLYDELGSTLFDAITLLPEYGLTRADSRLLERHSSKIANLLPGRISVAELGSGTGSKTRLILQALARRRVLKYHPIDISPTALDKCAAALEGIRGVQIEPFHASYLEGLQTAAARRAGDESLLVLFLGSTIGNFDFYAARQFVRDIRAILRPGDAFLLGTDLVKPVPQMLAAYDDALGVTAAFNLNVLSRVNRELGGQFNLRRFEHEARYNDEESRIEMHIRSRVEQSVHVRAIDRTVRFERGETIWTEGSYKFRRSEILEMAGQAGFAVRAQWIDEEWPFANTLLGV
jgi:L-histidine Nalpha-methyltransferase